MAKAKRIIFSFDEPSERQLVDLTSEGKFSSRAHAVREAVALFRLLQDYHKQGFTELYARNPNNNAELRVKFTSLELTSDLPSEDSRE
ncbi:MAG: hypothetical protein O3C40_17135 [Planctomycetota bacterium]|nr:hypothetical protein [Planctomycetota bacterium]